MSPGKRGMSACTQGREGLWCITVILLNITGIIIVIGSEKMTLVPKNIKVYFLVLG